jgi:hypothetical protein
MLRPTYEALALTLVCRRASISSILSSLPRNSALNSRWSVCEISFSSSRRRRSRISESRSLSSAANTNSIFSPSTRHAHPVRTEVNRPNLKPRNEAAIFLAPLIIYRKTIHIKAAENGSSRAQTRPQIVGAAPMPLVWTAIRGKRRNVATLQKSLRPVVESSTANDSARSD